MEGRAPLGISVGVGEERRRSGLRQCWIQQVKRPHGRLEAQSAGQYRLALRRQPSARYCGAPVECRLQLIALRRKGGRWLAECGADGAVTQFEIMRELPLRPLLQLGLRDDDFALRE